VIFLPLKIALSVLFFVFWFFFRKKNKTKLLYVSRIELEESYIDVDLPCGYFFINTIPKLYDKMIFLNFILFYVNHHALHH